MIALALAAQLALAPEPTPPDPRAVAQDVATLLEAGKVNEALAAIEAASAADPDPRYLFMRAALEEQLGRCSVAVPLYREFLSRTDDPMDRDEANAGLERCGAEPEPQPEAEPELEPEPTPAPPEPPAPEPTSPVPLPSKPWQRDALGWALLGSGAAIAATGGALLGVGIGAARDTRTVNLQSAHANARTRADRLQPAGIALLAVGSAIWVGGAVRMAIVDRRNPGRTAHLRRFDGFSIFF